MKAGVITFPGSNCDRDVQYVLENFFSIKTSILWHNQTFDDKGYDLIVLPGGFSYGDYLRCGAIAKLSKAMNSVYEHAKKGKPILGICNGFQILCEAKLLPGVLIRNQNLLHIAKDVPIVKGNFEPFQHLSRTYWIPVSHSEGNYYADEETIKQLKDEGRIAFYYEINVNGSKENIAGILSENKKILGMMPHPERATDPLNGKTDGYILLKAILDALL
ncbi:MAG: phosphoribosylformylglycinamidine synthase subunit PurQ [Leptospiraceae bacterium]|nr:phosphoribosylformylglycinamidine synthase subunit PurQ [Leptospiraceae bacterium]MDW7975918.1 phosphoribosylformylglycinamidine synthase subunit PurQ [Leptospiraceae bacterium]